MKKEIFDMEIPEWAMGYLVNGDTTRNRNTRVSQRFNLWLLGASEITAPPLQTKPLVFTGRGHFIF